MNAINVIDSLLPRQRIHRRSSRLLRQQTVHNDQRGHRLYNRYRPRHNTGIVSALGLKHTFLEIKRRRRLRLSNCRSGLERDAEEYLGPVRDAALYAAGVVRLGSQA